MRRSTLRRRLNNSTIQIELFRSFIFHKYYSIFRILNIDYNNDVDYRQINGIHYWNHIY